MNSASMELGAHCTVMVTQLNDNISKYTFFNHLMRLTFIRGIYLYGSRARGDNQSRSDIDLAIDAPDATIKEWDRVLEIIENSDTLLKIDCVRFDELKDNDPLRVNILKQGKLIYRRAS